MGKHITVTEINTNNAWGFGGMIGKETKYQMGIRAELVKRIFDTYLPKRSKSILTKKEIKSLKNNLKKLLKRLKTAGLTNSCQNPLLKKGGFFCFYTNLTLYD